jgi:hypothetical protein
VTGRSQVRAHGRKTASGRTAQVRQHTRRRGLVTPRHSWSLLTRAFRAGRRRKKVTAAVLGGLAVLELAAWLSLTGVALILATFAVLAGATAFCAAQASGMPTPSSGGRKPPQRGRPLADEPAKPATPAPAAPQPKAARPARPAPGRPAPASDPVAQLGRLGAIWSDDFDAYAGGETDASKVHCVLCQCAPCRCPPFGSDAYFSLLDFRHGRGKTGDG